MKLKRKDLTQELIKEFVYYDPLSGILTWRIRDKKWFPDGYRTSEGNACIWNSLWAGKQIGSLNPNGYLLMDLFAVSYKVHRIIWFYEHGEWPEMIDHIDGNKINNKLENLRSSNSFGNSKNRKLPSNSKTGIIGVYKRSGKFVAHIAANGKKYTLGTFENLEDAIAARKAAEIKHEFHENHGRNQ